MVLFYVTCNGGANIRTEVASHLSNSVTVFETIITVVLATFVLIRIWIFWHSALHDPPPHTVPFSGKAKGIEIHFCTARLHLHSTQYSVYAGPDNPASRRHLLPRILIKPLGRFALLLLANVRHFPKCGPFANYLTYYVPYVQGSIRNTLCAI